MSHKRKDKVLVKSQFGFPLREDFVRSLDDTLKAFPQAKYLKAQRIATKVELLPDERADISTITTDAIDTMGDVIIAKGIDRTNYLQNPIVCWAHNYDLPPIAKAAWITARKNGLVAKTVYAKRPETHEGEWFPDTVFALIQQEILRGKSIGMLATDMRPPLPEEKAYQGARNVIASGILLEYSVCPLPVNQEALTIAASKGFKLSDPLMKALGIKPLVRAKPQPSQQEIEALVLKKLNSGQIDISSLAERALANAMKRWRAD